MSSFSIDSKTGKYDPSLGTDQGALTEAEKTEEAAKGVVGTQGAQGANAPAGPAPVTDTVETSTVGGPNQGPAVPPPQLPPDTIPPTADEGASTLADNYVDSVGTLLPTGEGSTDIMDLSADNLMKVFLALNILNPNDSVETQNEMTEAMGSLKQLVIEECKKEIENLKERQAEAEKEKEMWSMLSTLFLIINPMGLLFQNAGDSEALGIIGGVLAPEQMLLSLFGSSKTDEELSELKVEIDLAEQRLERVEGMEDPQATAKKSEEEFAEAQQASLENTKVGEDGMPLKQLAASLKGKLGKVMEALSKILSEQGPQAMMQQAPELIKQACLEAFQEAKIPNAEEMANQATEIFMGQIASGLAGSDSPDQVVGPATVLLGETLDPESEFRQGPVYDDSNPRLVFSAGTLDALASLRAYAQNSGAAKSGPSYIS